MIDEQLLFGRIHAAFEVEPRPGMHDRIRAKLVNVVDYRRQSRRRLGRISTWVGNENRQLQILAVVAVIVTVALVLGIVVNALHRTQSVPSTNPRTGRSAVLAVDERWYWSANDAAVLVSPLQGSFPFATIEITHDGGRSWTVTRFEILGLVPTLQWFDSRDLVLYDEMGTVYRTTDGGDQWIASSLGMQLRPELTSFINGAEGWTLCPTVPGCRSNTNPGEAYTLYHTVDSGIHWQKLSEGFSSPTLGPTGVLFSDRSHGFISTYSNGGSGELFATADGGATWRLVALPSPNVQQQQFSADCLESCTSPPTMFGSRGVVFVRTPLGDFTYTTADGGLTWGDPHPLAGAAPTYRSQCCDRSMSAASWSDWWETDGTGALFRSENQGRSWVRIPSLLEKGTHRSSLVISSVKPVGGLLLWGAAFQDNQPFLPIQTRDGGMSWTVVRLSTATPKVYLGASTVNPQPTPPSFPLSA